MLGDCQVRGSSFFGYKSPGFDINDLGFQERADSISLSNWYQIRDDKPGAHVRNRNVNFNQWMGWNFGGDLRFSGGNINSHWTFTNNMSFGSGFNVNAEGFDDRLTRGGPGTSTELVNLHLYKVFFEQNQLGYGALLSLAVIAAIVAFLLVSRKATSALRPR